MTCHISSASPILSSWLSRRLETSSFIVRRASGPPQLLLRSQVGWWSMSTLDAVLLHKDSLCSTVQSVWSLGPTLQRMVTINDYMRVVWTMRPILTSRLERTRFLWTKTSCNCRWIASTKTIRWTTTNSFKQVRIWKRPTSNYKSLCSPRSACLWWRVVSLRYRKRSPICSVKTRSVMLVILSK